MLSASNLKSRLLEVEQEILAQIDQDATPDGSKLEVRAELTANAIVAFLENIVVTGIAPSGGGPIAKGKLT